MVCYQVHLDAMLGLHFIALVFLNQKKNCQNDVSCFSGDKVGDARSLPACNMNTHVYLLAYYLD